MGSTITPTFDISRKQIADFVKDPRTIRDVEALARMLREQVPTALTGKVDDTRILIAGAGLTGGGPLSADVTFDVGAGTGMIINADDIAIDLVAEAERIRDVIGTALTDTATIDFTADDAADTIKADLKNTAVTPGAYTSANITVDAQGRITAAASGSLGAGSVGATELASTTVTPGSYTNTNLTVDADGRLTAASNGSAGGGGSSALSIVPISQLYYSPDSLNWAASTGSSSANFISFFPFSKNCTIDALALEVTTAGAGGSTARAGLYTSNATTGLPDTLIEEATTQSIASTGTKVFPFASNHAITGPVWIAILYSATVTLRNGVTSSLAGQVLGSATISGSVITRYFAAYTFAALPANTSLLSLTSDTATPLAMVAARAH